MKTTGLQPSDLLTRIAPPPVKCCIASQTLWSFEASQPLAPRVLKSDVQEDRGVWLYASGCGQIEVEVTVQLDRAFPAGRVDVVLINGGTTESPSITRPCPLAIVGMETGRQQRMMTMHGGTTEGMFPPLAYRPREEVGGAGWIWDGEIRSHPEGRSSNQNIPLLAFMPDAATPGGFIMGLEWSGEWRIGWRRPSGANGLTLDAAVLVGPFTLQPGERLALPTAHMVWFDADMQSATQAIRRYLYHRVCARYEGGLVIPPVSYDHWFGIDNRLNDTLLRTQAARAAELGVEFFVVDAAWFEGNFPEGVGNWNRIDRAKFPHGLEALAEDVRSKGMKFGLWFEPERAFEGTAAVREHPEFFIRLPGNKHCHLNLSIPAAQDWLIEWISGMITRYDIRWSRWDYNVEPAAYWRQVDPSGKIQFAYMKGLYRVLDILMNRHPHWFVEQCASGGRRLDMGTMRRAHSYWFSDHTDNPDMCRAMQAGANHFLPGHLCNSSVAVNANARDTRLDDTAILSRMLGKLAFDGDIAAVGSETVQRMRHWSDWFKRIRHLLVADFHSLTSIPNTDRDACVGEFVGANGDEAVVFAFRHHAESDRMTVKIKGLRPEARYCIANASAPTEASATGRELAEGWTIHLDRMDTAGLWHFQSVSR